MKKATDKCLLCGENDAIKRNSHILPKFISTNFLGPKTSKREGFSLDGEMPISRDKNGEIVTNPRKVQDSPKEDYILCEECESYFGILETSCAPLYSQWAAKVEKGEFKLERLHEHFAVVECLTANASLNRLMVYSIFWRASISSNMLFSGYMLSEDLEQSLRCILQKYKSTKKEDVIKGIDQYPIPIYPYSMMTGESFEDETANVLAAINPENPAALHVDRFGFLLYNSISDLRDQININYTNKERCDLKLMVLSRQLWHELLVQRPLQMYANQMRRKLQ